MKMKTYKIVIYTNTLEEFEHYIPATTSKVAKMIALRKFARLYGDADAIRKVTVEVAR